MGFCADCPYDDGYSCHAPLGYCYKEDVEDSDYYYDEEELIDG